MTDVFISYSRKDSEFARQLINVLEAKGKDTWIDWHSIKPSTRWWQEICNGISGGNNFLFIMSDNSLDSYYCHREIEYARKLNKRFIILDYQVTDIDKVIGRWYGHDWEIMARENWEVLRSIQFTPYAESATTEETVKQLLLIADSDPEYVMLHTRYMNSAETWNNSGKNISTLLRGDLLKSAESWLKSADDRKKSPEPTILHREFINEGRRVENEELTRERRNTRLRNQLSIASIVFVLIAIVSIGATIIAINRVQTAADEIQSFDLLTQANSILEPLPGNAIDAALLSIRALDIAHTDEAIDLLDRALSHMKIARITTQLPQNRILNIDLGGNAEDGWSLIYVDYDGTAYRFKEGWEFSQPINDRDEGPYILEIQHTPGQEHLIATAWQEICYIVDEETHLNNRDCFDYPNNPVEFAVSPDERYLAVGGGRITVFDLQQADFPVVKVIDTNIYGALDLAFSPDGHYIATTSSYPVLNLWDVETGEHVREFSLAEVRSGQLNAGSVRMELSRLEYSPDGDRIALAIGNSVRIWNIDEPDNEMILAEGWGANDVAWLPSGNEILTTQGSTAVIMNIETGEITRILDEHETTIGYVDVTADGRYAMTASDSTYPFEAIQVEIRIWDINPPLSHDDFTDIASYIEYACSLFYQDFDDEDRELYGIEDETATCPQFEIDAD